VKLESKKEVLEISLDLSKALFHLFEINRCDSQKALTTDGRDALQPPTSKTYAPALLSFASVTKAFAERR